MRKNKVSLSITIAEISLDDMDTIDLINITEVIDLKYLKNELKEKFDQILLYIDKFLLEKKKIKTKNV